MYHCTLSSLPPGYASPVYRALWLYSPLTMLYVTRAHAPHWLMLIVSTLWNFGNLALSGPQRTEHCMFSECLWFARLTYCVTAHKILMKTQINRLLLMLMNFFCISFNSIQSKVCLQIGSKKTLVWAPGGKHVRKTIGTTAIRWKAKF